MKANFFCTLIFHVALLICSPSLAQPSLQIINVRTDRDFPANYDDMTHNLRDSIGAIINDEVFGGEDSVTKSSVVGWRVDMFTNDYAPTLVDKLLVIGECDRVDVKAFIVELTRIRHSSNSGSDHFRKWNCVWVDGKAYHEFDNLPNNTDLANYIRKSKIGAPEDTGKPLLVVLYDDYWDDQLGAALEASISKQ